MVVDLEGLALNLIVVLLVVACNGFLEGFSLLLIGFAFVLVTNPGSVVACHCKTVGLEME